MSRVRTGFEARPKVTLSIEAGDLSFLIDLAEAGLSSMKEPRGADGAVAEGIISSLRKALQK